MVAFYNFTKQVNIVAAMDNYFRQNNIPHYDGVNYNGSLLTVVTLQELTQQEQDALTTIVDNYVDPSYFLVLSRTQAQPMTSQWASTINDVAPDGHKILQTYIYTGNTQDTGEVLDGIKTIFEYKTDNVQNFLNSTIGNVSFEIYDITRNQMVTTRDIDLGTIAQNWQTQAQSGSTQGSIVYRTELFTGMMNVSPGYDCIWQMRGNPDGAFDFKMNAYQELYYSKLE